MRVLVAGATGVLGRPLVARLAAAGHEVTGFSRSGRDGVRAVDAVRSVPGVDPERVAVHGVSQGGGIAIAVAGLVPDVAAALPNVPFLCHYRRAVQISDAFPYGEITQYLAVHREHGRRLAHVLLPRRGLVRPPRPRGRALLHRPARRRVPAIHGVRRVQPVGRSGAGDPGQGDRRLPVQPARGRPGLPVRPHPRLARQAPLTAEVVPSPAR